MRARAEDQDPWLDGLAESNVWRRVERQDVSASVLHAHKSDVDVGGCKDTELNRTGQRQQLGGGLQVLFRCLGEVGKKRCVMGSVVGGAKMGRRMDSLLDVAVRILDDALLAIRK